MTESPATAGEDRLTLTVVAGPPGTTITVCGELDLATADQMAEVAADLPPHDAAVTIDVTGLTFLDSAGADGLLAVCAAASGWGAATRIVGATPLQALVLRRVGLECTPAQPATRAAAP